MNILLFNDNPVVRKLVALSAQKTKDTLDVVSSIDEIDQSGYDLLIIDDALYADGTFDTLKECITFNSSLLMATRGNAIPAGFDNVINKPFLPTDLVDMFIQIEKKVSTPAPIAKVEETPTTEFSFEAPYSINLDEELPDLGDDFDDSLDLGELDGFDESNEEMEFPNILDKEEVQEVQGLLEDTEFELKPADKAITVQEIDDLDDETAFDLLLSDEGETEGEKSATIDDLDFDFDLLDEKGENESVSMDELDMDFASLEDDADNEKLLFSDDTDANFSPLDEDLDTAEPDLFKIQEEDEFDDLMMSDLNEIPEDQAGIEAQNEFSFDDIADDELGDLEMQIQNAVDDLDPEILDMELESETLDMDDISINNLSLGDGLDELDMLDERELMKAIGEEFEDADETIFDKTGEEAGADEITPPQPSEVITSSSHVEGVAALQALLKALSNEEVAASLKGLNISININFGNEQ